MTNFTPDQVEVLRALGDNARDESGSPRRHRMVHKSQLNHLKPNALQSLVIYRMVNHYDGFYVLTRLGWNAYKRLPKRDQHIKGLRRGDTFKHGNTIWMVDDVSPGGVVYATYSRRGDSNA